MNKNKKMRNRIIKVSVFLVVLLGICAGGAACLWYQGAAAVVDLTQEQKKPKGQGTDTQNQEDDSGDGSKENEVVLNSNVSLLLDEDAAAVNDAIASIYYNDAGQIEINIGSGGREKLAAIGSGGIFYLAGDASTPFGTPYIGKIVSVNQKSNGTAVVVTETPGMDEAFDTVNLNIDDQMTADSISAIHTIEGVSITYEDEAADAYETASVNITGRSGQNSMLYQDEESGNTSFVFTNRQTGSVKKMKADIGTQGGAASGSVEKKKDGFVITYDLDFLKMIDAVKKSVSVSDKTLALEDEDLSEKRNSADEVLSEKAVNDFIESFNEDPRLNLKGKAVLSNVSFKLKSDWSILDIFDKCAGFTELSYDIGYQFQTESQLTLCAKNVSFHGTQNKLEFADMEQFPWSSGDDSMQTAASIGNQLKAKLSGLNDKLIPIASIQWTPVSPVVFGLMDPNQMNNLIHINAGMSPLSAAMIFYLDISGNISASVDFQFDYQQNFKGGCVFIRDGVWVDEGFGNKDDDTSWRFNFAVSADADMHMGLALDIYLFNVSIVDVNAFEIGAEGSGVGGVQVTSENPETPNLYADWYARLYCKLLNTHVNIKASAMTGKAKLSAGIQKDWTAKDMTWWQAGKKRHTGYDKNNMHYGQVTAYDKEFIYYLNESGNILKQNKQTGSRVVLCGGGMTKFCGIDASYLYLLKTGSSGYDIYRIDKNTGISRSIQKEVAAALAQDGGYLYYLSMKDETEILALNRESLNTKVFHDFGDEVQFMNAYGDYFYISVLTGYNVFLGASCHYYLMGADGSIVSDLGSDPDAKSLPRVSMPGYYYSARYAKRGMLRGSAEKMYWLSADLKRQAAMTEISGWSQKEAGVFVTKNKEGSQDVPYTIWLYEAKSGNSKAVADVYSDHAFFTLCQDAAGYWYFFDETEDALVLHKMDSNFENLTVVQSYDKSEAAVGLDDCSMEIVGNKMIFYSIVGEEESASARVIYRYDLY